MRALEQGGFWLSRPAANFRCRVGPNLNSASSGLAGVVLIRRRRVPASSAGVSPFIQTGSGFGLPHLLEKSVPLGTGRELRGMLTDLLCPGRQPVLEGDLFA